MDWKTMLSYISGSVDAELLLRNEYLVAENRVLRNQLQGRLHLTDGERRSCTRPVQKHKRTQDCSNGMPRSRAETWIQARAAPGPERASRLRRGSPGLDSGLLGLPLFRRCTASCAKTRPFWNRP